MRELGDNKVTYHQEIGQYAKEHGVDVLFTLGELTKHCHEYFSGTSQHFENHAKLRMKLGKILKSNDVVLVKGSKSMRMWEVLENIEK